MLSALPAPGVDSSRLTHDACPLLATSVREELPTTPQVPQFLAHLAVSHTATAPPRAVPPLPILATAPKASPPAHG